jgi:hypothetical protein
MNNIPGTSATLLRNLRDPRNQEAWLRADSIYRPLLTAFMIKQGLQSADADDLAQVVLSFPIPRAIR